MRRVEVELEGARGAIAQSNGRRDEVEQQLKHEQQQQQQLKHEQQQQQLLLQQQRIRIDELVRRCDDASAAAGEAKAATAAALARAEEAEVRRCSVAQKRESVTVLLVQGDCRTLLKDNRRLQESVKLMSPPPTLPCRSNPPPLPPPLRRYAQHLAKAAKIAEKFR